MARVLISMPEEFLDRIDQVAEGENRTRSELIREALRSYMYKNRVKANTMAGKNATILEALLDQMIEVYNTLSPTPPPREGTKVVHLAKVFILGEHKCSLPWRRGWGEGVIN